MERFISIENFADNTREMAIKVNNKVESRMVREALDRLGKKWSSGASYFNDLGPGSYPYYLTNKGMFAPDGFHLRSFIVFDFDHVRFDGGEALKSCVTPEIESVTVNEKKGVTTVVFSNGNVRMVKCSDNDTFSPEAGFAYCLALEYLGLSKTQFKKVANKLLHPKKK